MDNKLEREMLDLMNGYLKPTITSTTEDTDQGLPVVAPISLIAPMVVYGVNIAISFIVK